MRRLFYLLITLIFLQLFREVCFAQNWKALNPPLNVFNNTIYTLDITSSGNTFAAGDFVNGNNSRFVAYWNGKSWSELGGDTSGRVIRFATKSDMSTLKIPTITCLNILTIPRDTWPLKIFL